jgi:hypothetical protein
LKSADPDIALVRQLASECHLDSAQAFSRVGRTSDAGAIEMRRRIDLDTYLTRKDRVQYRHLSTRVQQDPSVMVIQAGFDNGLLVRLLCEVPPIPSPFPWLQGKSLDDFRSFKLFRWFNLMYYRVT